jgi:hypothetical protein
MRRREEFERFARRGGGRRFSGDLACVVRVMSAVQRMCRSRPRSYRETTAEPRTEINRWLVRIDVSVGARLFDALGSRYLHFRA